MDEVGLGLIHYLNKSMRWEKVGELKYIAMAKLQRHSQEVTGLIPIHYLNPLIGLLAELVFKGSGPLLFFLEILITLEHL